jgi:hypothetical protein
MKQFGHGEGYQYAHDVEGGVADMDCMPRESELRVGITNRYYVKSELRGSIAVPPNKWPLHSRPRHLTVIHGNIRML